MRFKIKVIKFFSIISIFLGLCCKNINLESDIEEKNARAANIELVISEKHAEEQYNKIANNIVNSTNFSPSNFSENKLQNQGNNFKNFVEQDNSKKSCSQVIVVFIHGLNSSDKIFSEMHANLKKAFPNIFFLNTKNRKSITHLSISDQIEICKSEIFVFLDSVLLKNITKQSTYLLLIGHSQGGIVAHDMLVKYSKTFSEKYNIKSIKLCLLTSPISGIETNPNFLSNLQEKLKILGSKIRNHSIFTKIVSFCTNLKDFMNRKINEISSSLTTETELAGVRDMNRYSRQSASRVEECEVWCIAAKCKISKFIKDVVTTTIESNVPQFAKSTINNQVHSSLEEILNKNDISPIVEDIETNMKQMLGSSEIDGIINLESQYISGLDNYKIEICEGESHRSIVKSLKTQEIISKIIISFEQTNYTILN